MKKQWFVKHDHAGNVFRFQSRMFDRLKDAKEYVENKVEAGQVWKIESLESSDYSFGENRVVLEGLK
jgi:hypothetical protein